MLCDIHDIYKSRRGSFDDPISPYFSVILLLYPTTFTCYYAAETHTANKYWNSYS